MRRSHCRERLLRESGDPAEAAAPYGYSLSRGRGGAARQRQGRRDIGAGGKVLPDLSRLRRAPRMRICFLMPLAELAGPQPAALHRWLVHRRNRRGWHRGVESGRAGTDPSGCRRLRRRGHLALAAPLIRGIARSWPVPFDSTVAEVLTPVAAQSACSLRATLSLTASGASCRATSRARRHWRSPPRPPSVWRRRACCGRFQKPYCCPRAAARSTLSAHICMPARAFCCSPPATMRPRNSPPVVRNRLWTFADHGA